MALAIVPFQTARGRNVVSLHSALTQLLDLSAAYTNYLQKYACLLPAYFSYLSLKAEIVLL